MEYELSLEDFRVPSAECLAFEMRTDAYAQLESAADSYSPNWKAQYTE